MTAPAGPLTMLVVDDEPGVLQSIQALLQFSFPGCRVATATGGPEALALLDREAFDLVISDYRMPTMDGLEFLAKSQEKHPALLKVLMTAFPKLEVAIEAINAAHVDRFIRKPFEPRDFVEKVRGLLVQNGRLR